MILEAEGRASLQNVTPAQIKRLIAGLKTYGPCSFASLIDENGNYLQVAGGRVTCMLEKRDGSTGRHFRAYQAKRSQVFEDGTMLVFGGGKIKLQADEWFTSSDIEEAFLAFLGNQTLPERIMWREITSMFEL